MQRRLKFLTIISLFLVVGTLSGCSSSNVQMPKVKGREVSLTNRELERKLERLIFEVQDDKIIESKGTATGKEVFDEETLEAVMSVKTTRNLANSDFWIEETLEQKFNEGILKATVSGFESDRYMYFDIERSSNRKFTNIFDSLNYNIYNGKYRIEKGHGLYDLEDVLDYYNVAYIEPDFATILEFTSLGLFLELNNYNYNKLKFYENDDYFSISLKADYKSLKSGRVEIYDVFDYYVGFPDEEAIKGFNYEIVLVFERNKLSAAGLNILTEVEEDDDGEYYYNKNEYDFACKYVEKLPKEISYNKYSLIEDLDELIK